MNTLFSNIDWILFYILAISTGYLFLYAIASIKRDKAKYPSSLINHKFLVLFPAYREDIIIVESVKQFICQNYPREQFDLVVISDQMSSHTNMKLRELSAQVLEISFESSSKAKALNYALSTFGPNEFDVVVIMDADNVVNNNFLKQISDAFGSGIKAMQAHRTAKNIDNDTSILDAVSEEINNSIFRKGHVNLGLSSALIGSGMAFDYKWFKSNIHILKSTGEDKELELLLLRDRIFVEYLDYIDVYDEKTTKTKAFFNQRRRWLATQFYILRNSIKYFPLAILNNWPLADKIIQWMLFPRILQLGLIGLFTILATIVDFYIAFKWWCLLSLLLITLIISIPKELFNRRLLLALNRIPLLFILMFLNLFRLRGASNKFIHTEKNQ